MPCPEVDWRPLEQGADLYPPFEVYGTEVDSEIARLEEEIRRTNAASSYFMNRLVSFGVDSDPEDSFVRHAAMLEVFDRRQLKEGYYDPDYNKVVMSSQDDDSWRLILREPGNPRYFLVSFLQKSKENRLLQILHYGKPN